MKRLISLNEVPQGVLRGFNPLTCSATIFFSKFSILTSLSLHFLVNIEGAYTLI